VVSPGIDEIRHPEESPSAYAERLAREKASAVAQPGTVVLAADTIVVHRGTVLGKPGHPAEARAMLHRLSGERHTVVSGVAVVRSDESQRIWADSERTAVSFLELTDVEISAYVESGEPMDKAGAYGLQGAAGAFVDRIAGSPSNVVGLPLALAVRLMRAAGVTILGQTS
jgi:septum formation protein